MSFSPRNKRLWIAGHNGMVGSALMRRFSSEDCVLLTADHATLDLRRQSAVEDWIAAQRPDAIIMAAATVGGIEANRSRPADFLYDNLAMTTNIIEAAAQAGVEKLLYLGSSCIYPRNAAQPLTPDSLLTGALEPTNEAYALAKIAGVKMCAYYCQQYGRDFISAMPCNLYGLGDRYDAVNSHVIPALLMKFHAAREENAASITIWGTGAPLREFLYVDDLADALTTLLIEHSGAQPVNVGSGAEISIRDLSLLIAELTGYDGAINFDSSMPDGTPRKLLDSGVMRSYGWTPQTDLRVGLKRAYDDYLKRCANNKSMTPPRKLAGAAS